MALCDSQSAFYIPTGPYLSNPNMFSLVIYGGLWACLSVCDVEKCAFVCAHVIVCVFLRMCAVDLVVPVILFLLTGMNTPLGWQCVEARPGRRAEE